MRKAKKAVALSLAAAICLAACQAGPSQTDTASEKGGQETAGAETTLTIWYEGSDARLPFFKEVEAQMQKDYPQYRIEAVTFDNSTFMTKVLQAATATGGVDLAFNDASRLLEIDLQSNGGFEDLSSVLEQDGRKDLVSEGDRALSSNGDRLVVYPVNRTIAGLGVKTDVSGVTVDENTLPKTWESFLNLGKGYQKAGLNGFTMILGSDPGQVFNLFLCGSGKNDVFVNGVPESQIEKNKDYFNEIISVYAGTEGFWDKDATSEDFAAMYTKIQSGSVGMFRAGNWNVANWDAKDSGVGEYQVTTWPSLDGSGNSGLVLLNTRGFVMPKNAKNKEAAKIFLQYALAAEAQKKSFETMGSCLDLKVVDETALTKNQKIFFDPEIPLYPIDNYVADIPYYNEIKDVYEKGLVNAVNSSSPETISQCIDTLHEEINNVIQQNQS